MRVLQQIGRVFFNQPVYEYRPAFGIEVFRPLVIVPSLCASSSRRRDSRVAVLSAVFMAFASTVNQICKLPGSKDDLRHSLRADDPGFEYRGASWSSRIDCSNTSRTGVGRAAFTVT